MFCVLNYKNWNNTVLALSLALCGAFCITCMNLFSKLLGSYFPPEQITFTRNIVALSLLLIGLILFRQFEFYKTKRLKAHILRTVLGTTAFFLSIWAYTIMPMANAATLIFTQPLWVALLSYPLLKEKVGLYRIIAVIIGFLGIVIAASPGSGFSAQGIVIGLSSGFAGALVIICLRWLGKTENPVTTVFYFLFLGGLITSVFLPITGKMPTSVDFQIIAAMALGLGVFGLISLLSKSSSYLFGDASLIAPINYTSIIWAGMFDYFIWDNLPDTKLIVGASIVIISNLFILWRERLNAKPLKKAS